MKHRLVICWLLLSLVAACSAPVKRPASAVKSAPTRKEDPLERYWRTQAARLGLNSLVVLRDNVRDIWNEPRKLREGVFYPKAQAAFPPSGSGWFPPRTCCSFPGRRCAAVDGVPPTPWVELRFIAVKAARHWQYRYFSSGVGANAAFVADARGDPGCTGRRLWFRIEGRVAGPDLGFVVHEPVVVKGEDPRHAPLPNVEVLERAVTGPREELHHVAVYHLLQHKERARPVALRLLGSKEARLRLAAATLLWRTDLKLVATLLKDPDERVRRDVREQFARQGPRHDERQRLMAEVLGPLDAGGPDAGTTAPDVAGSAATGTLKWRAPLGLAACDDFLVKYERCAFTRAPPVTHKAFRHAIDTLRESYHKAARAPGTRKMVARSCREIAVIIKKAMATFNCQW